MSGERIFAGLAALLTATCGPLAGQSAPADTIYHLDEIVVVAHRAPTLLRESVAATSVLTQADIERIPARNLAEILQHVPGISFVERDGAGQLPMAVARGFFGGGETSYVLLTLNGMPINDARTGLAEWSQISVAQIERIEVLRGSASVVYGDAALGAVVNIVTTENTEGGHKRGAAYLGAWGDAEVSGSLARDLDGGSLGVTLAYGRDRGHRDHSRSSRLTSALTHETRRGGTVSLRSRLSLSILQNQEPGALTPDALAQDRRGSHPAFGADERTRRAAGLTLAAARDLRGDRRLSADIRFRLVDQERVRTLLLAPTFGDTQLHDEQEWSLWSSARLSTPVGGGTVLVGVEGEVATFDSEYLDPVDRSTSLSIGEGSLWRAATHVELRRPLGAHADLHAGVRFDAVRPEDRSPDAGPAPTFRQWSPRIALNVTYRDDASSGGNLFVTWSRAFKSPSLDQLYDEREIPAGPGVSFNISSPELKPQRSSAFEVGIFQKIPLGSPLRHVELSASAYHQQLDDEIDFDIRTFKYGNIQESRHLGVEASARVRLSSRVWIDYAATLNRVTFRSGEHEGNQLKSIPKRILVGSLHLGLGERARLSFTHRSLGGAYVDDANRVWLEGADLLDAGFRWTVSGVEASLIVRNLLDTQYASLGYLLFDPAAGADVLMTFPGGGRFLRAGISVPGRLF